MKLVTTIVLVLASMQVWAVPAAWYQWRSKLNGDLVCRQTSPGTGWEKAMGPYTDARCEIFAKR